MSTPTNAPGTVEDALTRAQRLVNLLLANGLSHNAISESLGGRVSARTVYRWAKGEHAPQRQGDLVALEKLAKEHVPA